MKTDLLPKCLNFSILSKTQSNKDISTIIEDNLKVVFLKKKLIPFEPN